MLNKILVPLLSMMLFSCIEENKHSNRLEVNSIKNETMQKIDTVRLSDNIDSVEVICSFFNQCLECTLSLSKTHFNGDFVYGDKEKFVINSLEKRNRFVNYINRFYIKKSDSIVLSKSSEPVPVTNYPSICVKSFKGEKEMLNKDVTLYSNIEFHPKFIEFYEFLDELITEQ